MIVVVVVVAAAAVAQHCIYWCMSTIIEVPVVATTVVDR